MSDFLCLCVLVALLVVFVLTLAEKWGIREWLQIHAPNDFLHKLFMCDFCCCWWLSIIISLTLFVVAGWLELLAVAPFSTIIAVRCRR